MNDKENDSFLEEGMDCGIALFIYDRPQCTEKVLESLKRNHIDELYVFQDGLGEQTNRAAWEENVNLIRGIDWCKVVYEKNESKAGSLDEQIIHGINKVFQEKEEIIVIEDDCVISDDCIDFFIKCFKTYKNNKKVISIDAYLEPITIPDNYKLPVIASGSTASWGWGTWKDRWEEFQKDFEIIKRIGKSMEEYKEFSSFGYTIKKILTGYWLLWTWDIWWSINILIKRGISIRPTYNKVHNIGFENPGTHTSGKSQWVVPICDKTNCNVIFPENICIEPWAEAEFKKFYQTICGRPRTEETQTYYRNCLEKWLEVKQQGKSINELFSDKGIRNIAIYGIGSIGKLLVNELSGQNRIEYFIVTNKSSDYFMEYSVFGFDEELPKGSDSLSLIVIPGYELKEIEKAIGDKFQCVYSIEEIFA